MMINWFDTLLDYTFHVIHLPGTENILPDHLSRLFEGNTKRLEGDMAYKPTKLSDATRERITSERYASKTQRVFRVHKIENNDNERMTAPIEERNSILERSHLFGHIGAEAMVKDIHHNQGYHWTNILHDAVDYVKKCQTCQRNNISKRGYHPLRPIYAYLPGDHWAMDLAGEFEESENHNKFLLILVDVCTRFCLLRPIPNKEAKTIAKELVKVFSDFGYPRIIQSDNGAEFKNQLLKEVLDNIGVDHRLSTPYHPQANGLAERWVQSAVMIIRKSVDGTSKDWDYFVPATQLALNNKISKRLNTPPFTLMFARKLNPFRDYRNEKSFKPMSQAQLLENIEHMTNIVFPAIKARTDSVIQQQKEQFDNTHNITNFTPGDHVMVKIPTRTGKLTPVYEGPYRVLRKNNGGAYELQDETGELLPRNYTPSELKLVDQDELIPADELYEVESIINHRGKAGNREYLVRWKGYGPQDDSWLTPDKFSYDKTIKKYWERRKTHSTNNDLPASTRKRKRAATNVDMDKPTRRSKRSQQA
ncbi:hypothetical protein O0I10_013106 [Lichtheimia ornata]|uniref:Uncharacterized protein n=1 Tax=Lichtheimia ornata TaxID=688661 RepID=A0AAD7URK6_9FUNG|nr:uncharacterized protein O0I10_013106 [Lichtheimia ornata]KAJ8651374.1 hypothetical protein O0I10_013106 [Lichtheimia ornata]